MLSVLKESFALISSRPAIQILDSFLFSVSGGNVVVTSGDGESSLSYRLPDIEATGEGAFCIGAKKCMEIMKSIPNCTVEFEVDGTALTVRYPNGKFNLAIEKGDEYPRRKPADAPDFTEEFDADEMVRGIEHSLFAVSTDTIRPVMTAVCIDVAEDFIGFVASDTHILSFYKIAAAAPHNWTGKILVGSKAATALSSLLRTEKKVTVASYRNMLEFSTGLIRLRTKVVLGKYPDYRRILPQSFALSGSIGLDGFLSAVKRVSLTAPETALLKCSFSQNVLEISACNLSFQTSSSERISCTWESADMAIGLHAEYLKKVLSVINSSSVRVQSNAPDRPFILVPTEDESNVEWTVLMMPMQIVE